MQKKAVILLSGGLDSTTCLAIAKSQGYDCHCISFDYGQKNNIELQLAAKQAQLNKVTHYVISLDPLAFKGSALTEDIAVPQGNLSNKNIPATYVPARNTIFLSYALGIAEQINSNDIFIGVNALDYSGYPDCRPEYIKAYENMANLATKRAVEGQKLTIHTPLINLTKAEIIKLGKSLDVNYDLTISCYNPVNGKPCKVCDACLLRQKGFDEANI